MKNKKGITLIALVITIIILLILAGVVLNLVIGEHGIIKLAEKAGKNYQDASMYEQSELEKLYAEMTNGELPENTPETDAGTKVKLPDEWKTVTPNYIEMAEGKIVKQSTMIATVEAISVGNGETVPVPIGFYYVGGDLSSGVVISDNIADRNKYAGQRDVPSGIKVNADGTLGNEFAGNQFVWIPCEYSGYTKTNWGQGKVTGRSNACWDTTVDEAGIIQTKKYGGFYVGRFEAGLASNIEEYTSGQTWNATVYNVEGIPQSKAGLIPWNFIDWTQSRKNARNMYNTATVNSGLITGTQWDVMINKIASSDSTKSLTDSENWGNHYNTTLTYTGRSATLANNILSVFGQEETNEAKNGNTYVLITTGGTDIAKAYNIYDVAGNVWEWTEETSYYGANTTTEYRELRGGGFDNASDTSPVCHRYGSDEAGSTAYNVGFRVVLYMK